MTDQTLERFWEKVLVDPLTGCWNWTFHTNHDGYGRFQIGKKFVYAHRFSYEVNRGIIPKPLVIDHLCRNRKCVNPDHLEVVTNRENILRGIGLAAIESRKTHCPYGHPYSGDNLYINARGSRECVICRKEQYRLRQLKKRGGEY